MNNVERVTNTQGCRSWSAKAGLLFFGTLLAIMLLGFESKPVYGQVEAGTVSGTVKDSTGAVVAGASVTAKNLATGAERSAQSGDNGQYSVAGLNPGTYEVSVSSSGFAPFKARAEVSVGGRTTVDAQLTISGQITTVEVVAGEIATVNTDSQEISEVISPEQMAQLPSLNRNAYDFVATAGNVSSGDRMGSANDQNTGTRGVGYVINGQRSSGSEILLDGAENVDLFTATVGQAVSPDVVQEYRIITNNFEAQYGRASGGVVNVLTKSGTSAYHGTAWEYNRISAYTANTFDNDSNGNPKGSFTRNQFGYGFGGPILKDKLFFYQSTEFTRVRSSASSLSLVPTPQLLALTAPNVQAYFNKYGANSFTFTSTLSKTTDPTTGQPKVGTTLGTLNGPFAGIPDGTPVFGKVNFNVPQDAGGGSPQNTHNIFGRLDYVISNNTQAYFRVNWTDEVDFSGAAFGGPYAQYNVGSEEYGKAFLVNVSHTFTPSVFSSTKLSFNRVNNRDSYNTALQNTPTLFLFNSATLGGSAVQLPGFFDNQTGTGGLPFGGPENAIQGNEDLNWSRGRHTMRFGGQFNYQQMNRGFGAFAQAVEKMGNGAADGLDNFINGKLVLFHAAISAQMLLAPNSPIGELWKPRYGDLGPRVGFAYALTGDGKTSIRGGYGISYERNFGNVTFNMIQNPPNYASVQLTGANAGQVTVNDLGPFAGAAGMQAALPPSSPRHVNQNIKTAQTQMWSLSAERELAKNTILSVDYNGAHGVHLYDISNYNMLGGAQAYLGDSPNCPPPNNTAICFTRVNQQWSSINTR